MMISNTPMRNLLLTVKNTIKRYEPFTIKEVFHGGTVNDIVYYAVFVDDDPFENDLAFFAIIDIEYIFAPGTSEFSEAIEVSELPVKVVESTDDYFLSKLAEILEKQMKEHQAELIFLQKQLNEWLANPSDDPIDDKGAIEHNKKMIKIRKARISFNESSKKKFFMNYPDYK